MAVDEILFRVNETFANEQSVADKGFTQSSEVVLNSVGSRNLTANPSIIYNNTNITCLGIKKSPLSIVTSDIALLLVQGE